jgi:Tol biopolymer transport system component
MVPVKKWIIIGVVIAVVVIASVAGVGYVVFRQSYSRPDVVKSLTDLPRNGRIWPASWSPDGQKILYESPGVWVVDADGLNEVHLGEGDSPVWSPDGSQVALATDNGLVVVNADGGGRRLLVDLGELDLPESDDRWINSPAWSPDGGMIAFEAGAFIPDPSDVSEQTGTSISGVWIVDADGSNLRRLAKDLAVSCDASWSPDGGSIAFRSRNGEDWDIYVADVVTGGLRQLTASPATETDLRWSPSSGSIAFVSRSSDASDIYVVDVAGGGLQQLTTSPANDWEPRWSPDGSKIAFVSGYTPGKDEDPEIWLMDADGSNKVRLAEGSQSYDYPAWSPDGSMIAYSSTRLGPVGDIWLMNADGSGKTKLTRTSRSSFACNPKYICYEGPKWSPDGAKLLFLNRLTEWEGWGSSGTGYDRLWVLEMDLEKGLG